MGEREYLTAPDPKETRLPKGIPFIIGNELAERFSFYGMKAILTVFMTEHLLTASGEAAYMSDERAKTWYHAFNGLAYTFPILGAILSDAFWGKYKTILLISLMYCLGHGMLALMDLGPHFGIWDMKPFLAAGLILIAIGAGGIKPCVSAHVGDQFGSGNKNLLTQIFNWFYFSINVGAAASSFLTPVLLAGIKVGEDPATGEAIRFGGPWLAFGLPGVLMAIATLLFWLGRHVFVHVPPAGWENFKHETFSPEGKTALRNLAPLFLIFVPVFWAIFDQTGSAWVLQAESMNREFLGITWLKSQVQLVNPILILTGIPFFTYVVYPFMGRFFEPTPLRKIGIGFVLTAMSFAFSAIIEIWIASKSGAPISALWQQIGAEGQAPATLAEVVKAARETGMTQAEIQPFIADMPSIGWQFFAYFILTAGEIMVSIVCLEFAYTQSPKKMKSFIMGVFFLGVALGNYLTMGVNAVLDALKDEQGNPPLDGAGYYWFFSGLMLVTTVAYIIWSKTYTGREYIQGEDDVIEAEAEAEGTDPR